LRVAPENGFARRPAARLDRRVNDEWFDVVDASDRVIGRERRSEVHRFGLRHRAVHVLVFDRFGRIFLQKRSASKDTAPGAWDSSASGHVDSGEDYDACAVRELREELGWTPAQPPEPVFAIEARPETGQEFVRVYRTEGEGPFRLHPEEIETGEWFEPDEVDARIAAEPGAFASSFRWIWAAWRRRSGTGEG
jgi:isopentenyldiphosphate isomerase